MPGLMRLVRSLDRYAIFSGGRVLDFIYANSRGFVRKKALQVLRTIEKHDL